MSRLFLREWIRDRRTISRSLRAARVVMGRPTIAVVLPEQEGEGNGDGGRGGERTERPSAELPAVKPVALAGALVEEKEPEHEFLKVGNTGRD